MNCPYCISDIHDDAIACVHCGRDFYLFKPLLQRISVLEAAVKDGAAGAALEARCQKLEQALADLQQQVSGSGVTQVEVPLLVERAPATVIGTFFKVLIPVIVLLATTHWLLLFIYDVKPLYLRLATILIPVPFGIVLAMRHPQRMWLASLTGFVTAVLAVLAMLSITAVLDKVPLLPENVRDVREVIEFVVSIGLSFMTGIMACALLARSQAEAPVNQIVLLLAQGVRRASDGNLSVVQTTKTLNTVICTVAPTVTGMAAIYSGLKAFFG